MRIAHIVCTYPPYYGGMGNVVFETANELLRRGHEVEVFTPLYNGEPTDEDEAHVRRLAPAFHYGNAAYLPKLRSLLNDFDIVHLHYPFFGTANLVRRWKLKHPERPLIITYHMDNRASGWKGLLFDWYAAYWLPKILGAADALIGSSFDYIAASDAGRLFQAQKNKWQEIPFGVDIERFQPREKSLALLKRYNFNPEIPVVLFVGGMDAAHYFKGVDVLLQALLLLKKRGVVYQALLVGDGELRTRFLHHALGLGIQRQVQFAGRVPFDELPQHYNLARVLVLPSINAGEAFGMVLLEAMGSGVPVIASDLPGVRTVAIDGGMTVMPKDPAALSEAIERALATPIKSQEELRQVVEKKYSWQSVGDKLEAVYKGL